LRDRRGNRLHFSRRGFDRDARSQTADRLELARTPITEQLPADRQPDLGDAIRRSIEPYTGRHDARDDGITSVQLHVPADDTRIAAELPLPERMADDDRAAAGDGPFDRHRPQGGVGG